MDQDRLDHVARGLASGTSRRGLLGAGAACVALLAAKPVAAGQAAKPHAPHTAPKTPGTGQPGNSPPGGGQLGSGGPAEDYPGACADQCDDAIVACQFRCPDLACDEICDREYEACIAACPPR